MWTTSSANFALRRCLDIFQHQHNQTGTARDEIHVVLVHYLAIKREPEQGVTEIKAALERLLSAHVFGEMEVVERMLALEPDMPSPETPEAESLSQLDTPPRWAPPPIFMGML